MSRTGWWVVAAIAFVALWAWQRIIPVGVNLLWFNELGYRSYYVTILETRAALAAALGGLFFFIVYANLWLARRWAPPVPRLYSEIGMRERAGDFARRGLDLLLLLGAAAAAALAGMEAATHWDSYLLFTHAMPFHVADPIFHRDVSFYVFTLPFLIYLKNWAFVTLFLATAATAGIHAFDRGLQVVTGIPRLMPHVKVHLSVLVALLLLVAAWGYQLANYGLLTTPGHALFGAGYTDVHARMMANHVLAFLAVVAAVVCVVNIFLRGITLPAVALAGMVAMAFLLGGVYPSFVQQVRVTPNEFALEAPYIQNNISLTRRAYGLDRIESRNFPVSAAVTPASFQDPRDQPTLQNVRLWDYRPLLTTYQVQQSLRQYYDFTDVDVDRYKIGGQTRETMLSARQLDLSHVSNRSWVTDHLQYTHGYGIVMNAVNGVTASGSPQYLVKDIPPTGPPELAVRQPAIYYGNPPLPTDPDQPAMDLDYCIVGTAEKELDYDNGTAPVYKAYTGTGGVPLGGTLRRALFASYFGDVNFLLSDELKPTSRVMFNRTIQERVEKVAPFLALDPDPYMALAGGRLYWIQDAYTYSPNYPYSETYRDEDEGFNYIRNSVKAVVDAYNGTVTLFVSDPSDPIIQAWGRIFPGLLKPMSTMPNGLLAHIRYPEFLFKVQTWEFKRYHMTSPLEFYQSEDEWSIAQEKSTEGQTAEMEPYYVIMRLPGPNGAEFVLMRPYTPKGKSNMVAWMAARCDPDDYGKLFVYNFPKGSLTASPALIESRIDQDRTISPQLSLWNQQGSKVIRGNLLVLPIGKTILYVEPLYLKADTGAAMPELQEVIVAGGQPTTLAMQPTFDAALAQVVGASQPLLASPAPSGVLSSPGPPGAVPGSGPPGPVVALPAAAAAQVRRATGFLDAAQAAQRRGDWAAYGQALQSLQQSLATLKRQAGIH